MFTKSRKLQTGDEGADDTDNNIAKQTKACQSLSYARFGLRASRHGPANSRTGAADGFVR
jgi:hypothetical protein